MNLDTLLDDARPDHPLTLREQAALEQLIQAHPRADRRRRARWVGGIAALSAFLLAGGATAAAAAGIWHPSWYDADSDWTTEVKTVHRTFTVDGQKHSCDVTFTLASTYNGKGTPEFQKALSYWRSLDPLSIRSDAATLRDMLNADYSSWGRTPSRPWLYQQAWSVAVGNKVNSHIAAIGLDPQKISGEVDQNCDFTR